MDVELITMEPEQAKESLKAYRMHLHRRADAEYQAVAAGLEALAEGKPVISLTKAIREGGFDEQMRPRLAIARADRRQVHFFWSGGMPFGSFDTSRGFTGRMLSIRVDLGQEHGLLNWYGPKNARKSYDRTVRGYALVPMIPAAARDDSGVAASYDRDHFILWEVEEWSDQPLVAEPPRDPFLLRHLGGDAYAVLAAWDLTDLERLVMDREARGVTTRAPIHRAKVQGERNGAAKLDEEAVLEILELEGVPSEVVAEAYGVSSSLIRQIWRGFAWGWLTGRGS